MLAGSSTSERRWNGGVNLRSLGHSDSLTFRSGLSGPASRFEGDYQERRPAEDTATEKGATAYAEELL